MRNALLVISIMALAVFAAPESRAQAACEPRIALEEWLKWKYPTTGNLKVLAFDHDSGKWSAWRWNGTQLATSPDIEIPHSDDPTVVVTRDSKIGVVVVSTNPFVYAARQTGSEEKPLPDLAAIQEVATGIARFATGVIVDVRRRDIAQPAGVEATAAERQMIGMEASRKNQEITAWIAAARTTTGTTRLQEHAELVSAKLESLIEPLEKIIAATSGSGGRVGAAIRTIDARWDNTFAMLQRIEHRNTSAAALDPAELTSLPDMLAQRFSEFRTAREALSAHDVPCADALTLLDEAITLELETARGDHGDVARAVRRIEKIAESLNKNEQRTGCTDDAMLKAIRGVASWIDGNAPVVDKPLDATGEAILEKVGAAVGQYLALVAARTDVLKKGAELLADQAKPTQRAGRLASIGLVQNAAFPPTPSNCLITRGVIEIQRPQGHEHGIEWSKVRTETFAVAPREAVKPNVVVERPEKVERKYHLMRRLPFEFDVTTAVTYTDIVEPEFGTASRSVPRLDAAGNPVTDIDGQPLFKTVHVPVRKSEDTRAGKLAMLLAFGPEAWQPFAAEIGFGLDTNAPSFYGGLSYGVGSFIRISAGRTWQQVTRLAPGITLDTQLASADELETVKGYDNDWYAALSIVLDELPIFNNK